MIMLSFCILHLQRKENGIVFHKLFVMNTGLCHLHSQRPPVIHGNFNTANVLVDDENFIAKVADAGVSRLLEKIDDAGPSQSSSRASAFRDPE